MSRNVALLVLDTVRLDYFNEYAPRLGKLADLTFKQCYAASSWSTPSHASLFTGALPHQHGIHAHNLDFSDLSPQDTFLGDMPDHKSVGTSTNLFAGPSFGFDVLFDEFPSVSRHGVLPGGVNIEEFHQQSDTEGLDRYRAFLAEARKRDELIPSLVNGAAVRINDLVSSLPVPRLWDYGADAIIRGAQSWLTDSDDPFFFFANFMEAHSPYEPCCVFDDNLCDVPAWWIDDVDEWDINTADDPQTEYGDYIQNRRRIYAGAVDYLDRKLTPFVRELVDNTERETTVIITADHGENLVTPTDGHLWGHVGSLSEALLHVPFIVVNPPDGHGLDEDKLVSHLDVGNLIAAISDAESHNVDRDYVPAERIGIGVSEKPEDTEYWDRAMRCAVTGDMRYEWDSNGATARYRIDGPSAEILERTDIKPPSWVHDEFDDDLPTYKQRARREQQQVDVDQATRDALEELGYL